MEFYYGMVNNNKEKCGKKDIRFFWYFNLVPKIMVMGK